MFHFWSIYTSADRSFFCCRRSESTQTSQVEFELGTPCAEDQMNDDCAPLFFSIQQNPDMATAISVCTGSLLRQSRVLTLRDKAVRVEYRLNKDMS